LTRVKVYSSIPAVRAGLERLLEGDPELQILAAHEEPPDVAVLSGESVWRSYLMELLEGRLTPGGVLLISDEGAECRYHVSQAEGRYTWGVLPTGVTPSELRAAVLAAAQGLITIHPTLYDGLRVARGSYPAELVAELTDREREVLDLLSKGFTNPEIAGLLGISEHTVKFHTSSLYVKLGVANRTEAVRVGIRTGAIHL
jgi:DNA-binding CsgD family transcriptional regulator